MASRPPLQSLKYVREYADRIEGVQSSNSMRSSDKTLYPQQLIQEMSADVGVITPTDIRELRAQRLRHIDYFGLVNEKGFDEKNLVEDMKD